MQTEDQDDVDQPAWQRLLRVLFHLWMVSRLMLQSRRPIWQTLVGSASDKRAEQKQVQELAVWTPPLLSLRFFACVPHMSA